MFKYIYQIIMNTKHLKYQYDIMKTCPCNEHPRTPHFCIGKLKFTRVFTIFLFLL